MLRWVMCLAVDQWCGLTVASGAGGGVAVRRGADRLLVRWAGACRQSPSHCSRGVSRVQFTAACAALLPCVGRRPGDRQAVRCCRGRRGLCTAVRWPGGGAAAVVGAPTARRSMWCPTTTACDCSDRCSHRVLIKGLRPTRWTVGGLTGHATSADPNVVCEVAVSHNGADSSSGLSQWAHCAGPPRPLAPLPAAQTQPVLRPP
jgi:hypothetical protein